MSSKAPANRRARPLHDSRKTFFVFGPVLLRHKLQCLFSCLFVSKFISVAPTRHGVGLRPSLGPSVGKMNRTGPCNCLGSSLLFPRILCVASTFTLFSTSKTDTRTVPSDIHLTWSATAKSPLIEHECCRQTCQFARKSEYLIFPALMMLLCSRFQHPRGNNQAKNLHRQQSTTPGRKMQEKQDNQSST